MTTAEKGLYTYKMYTQCTHTHIDNVGKKINCFSEIMYLIEPKLYKNDYWWNV